MQISHDDHEFVRERLHELDEMKERLTVADFYDAIVNGEGYIVITDAARPAIATRRTAPRSRQSISRRRL